MGRAATGLPRERTRVNRAPDGPSDCIGWRLTEDRMGQEAEKSLTPRATRRTGAKQASVQEFLDRFARCITSGDGPAIAELWEVPAFVLADDMARFVSTAHEVAQFFGGAREQYNARGITDTRAEILRLEWLTPRMVSVDVRWPYLDSRGREIGEERSTYTLRRGDDGALRVRIAIMKGASEPH